MTEIRVKKDSLLRSRAPRRRLRGVRPRGGMEEAPIQPEDGRGADSVTLTGFALELLAAVGTGRERPEQAVDGALRRYLSDRALRPPGWACLPLPEGGAADGGSAREVGLGEELRAEVVAEAAAQS